VGQSRLHPGYISHWLICDRVREHRSQAGTDQGPLLQHEKHLRAHRCKYLFFPFHSILRLDPPLIQAVVKHSQDKYQFLKVSIKRMQETQMYEDELKKANEYNSILSTQLQELEAKCTEESQLKAGKFLSSFYLVNPIISKYTLD
jgi:hypothetical protein